MTKKRKPKKSELEILREDSVVQECYDIALQHFRDEERTNLWFRVINPALGLDMPSPIDLINRGKAKYLLAKLKETVV